VRDKALTAAASSQAFDAPRQLVAFVRQQLDASLLQMSGEVLYSGAATLTKGEVYLLGHNPGGDPNNPRFPTVGGSLDALPARTVNGYTGTVWNGQTVPGAHPLQLRVVWLLSTLGLNPQDVAASNLIFMRSRDAASSQYDRFAELCWPVHDWILNVVRPRLVIVYGNSDRSPYGFLARKFAGMDSATDPQTCWSGHGDWACRSFLVRGRFRVVGLPHLSRYKVSAHPKVGEWIKSLMGTAPQHSAMAHD
jgi:hypothetical protein